MAEWFLYVCLCFALVVSAEGVNITVTAGQDATLPCPAKKFMPLGAVEWSRPGTETQYVLVFRMPNPELQIPGQRHQGRVELKKLRNGDASLVLRSVTAADGGTYQCHVGRKRKRSKGATRLIRTVNLEVLPLPTGAMDGGREDGGNQDGSVVSRGVPETSSDTEELLLRDRSVYRVVTYSWDGVSPHVDEKISYKSASGCH